MPLGIACHVCWLAGLVPPAEFEDVSYASKTDE